MKPITEKGPGDLITCGETDHPHDPRAKESEVEECEDCGYQRYKAHPHSYEFENCPECDGVMIEDQKTSAVYNEEL